MEKSIVTQSESPCESVFFTEHQTISQTPEVVEKGGNDRMPCFAETGISMTVASVTLVSELCRRRNDLLSQPLDVTLYSLGIARDRANYHLMHAGVTVPFHLVYLHRRADARRDGEV